MSSSGLGDELSWIDAQEVPWGVRVLDVRPITQGMLSTSNDPQCAQNAVSFYGEDGSSFLQELPQSKHTEHVGRRYQVDGRLYDGPLFIPDCMEHKWAIFYRQGRLIFVRSWLREVYVVADVEHVAPDMIEVTTLYGDFSAGFDEEDEAQGGEGRVLDYLLRSHAMQLVYPAPLPQALEEDARSAGLWCMRMFGKLAYVASAVAPPDDLEPPQLTLRSFSMLHLAVARGDKRAVAGYLERGWPSTLLANDGLTLMHWALSCEDRDMMGFLVEQGVDVDVRSAEGATALMNAVQSNDVEAMRALLALGAEVNAADARGFGALHRAAEMGHVDAVRALLAAGADVEMEAHGHTPRSLAVLTGEQEIVALLEDAGAAPA